MKGINLDLKSFKIQ